MALFFYALPTLAVLIALEALWARRVGARGYDLRDSAASVATWVASVVAGVGFRALIVIVATSFWTRRLVDMPNAWWSWVVLVIVDDFCFYWFHRASHAIRI